MTPVRISCRDNTGNLHNPHFLVLSISFLVNIFGIAWLFLHSSIPRHVSFRFFIDVVRVCIGVTPFLLFITSSPKNMTNRTEYEDLVPKTDSTFLFIVIVTNYSVKLISSVLLAFDLFTCHTML